MKNLIAILIALLSTGCAVYNGPMVDDLYHPGQSPSYRYVDPDRGYLRMRSVSPRWRTFDDDFYYWNFAPGVIGVGDPMGGWNTWRWYSPGFPVYGAGAYPWYRVPTWRPYSIYGGWNTWQYPYGRGGMGTWGHLNAWSPYTRPTPVTRDPRHTSPRQFNLGTYGTAPRGGQSPQTRTFGTQQPSYQPRTATQGQSTTGGTGRGGSPTRTFGQPQPTYQPRTTTQGAPRVGGSPSGSAPVRKFDRP